jgi:hypothetical protein
MQDLLAKQAEEIASAHLADALPVRWKHVQAVAHKAERLGAMLFDAEDARILAAAAWLHDIGYAPGIADTGFHPLDGARWLQRNGFDERVVSLVAHHSYARFEAEQRGMQDALRSFPFEDGPVFDALLYADMSTGPQGQDFEVAERLDEIVARYGKDHVVTQFIERRKPSILAAAERVKERLKQAAPTP